MAIRLISGATKKQKIETAKHFYNALLQVTDAWDEPSDSYVMDYLENDLERFEKQIREEMLRNGAAIE